MTIKTVLVLIVNMCYLFHVGKIYEEMGQKLENSRDDNSKVLLQFLNWVLGIGYRLSEVTRWVIVGATGHPGSLWCSLFLECCL